MLGIGFVGWVVVVLSALGAISTTDGVLRLEVRNVQQASGWIWVGVYDSEDNFLIKERSIVEGVQVRHTGAVQIPISGVRYGECAVAAFHDINGNGELDRNWLGIPTEPYAFSRRPPSKWRLPRFWEVAFSFAPGRDHISVVLDTW